MSDGKIHPESPIGRALRSASAQVDTILMRDVEPKPQGRPISELRAIVRADLQRWDELGELWGSLQPHEQIELIETAKAMIGPEPQSLRA